jgi:hypothetical protein
VATCSPSLRKSADKIDGPIVTRFPFNWRTPHPDANWPPRRRPGDHTSGATTLRGAGGIDQWMCYIVFPRGGPPPPSQMLRRDSGSDWRW